MQPSHLISFLLLSAAIISCKSESATADHAVNQIDREQTSSRTVNDSDYTDLITTVYEKFVFATDLTENNNPENYFTTKALTKLQSDYEFDCEDGPCYAYYALRTMEQDSKPGSNGESTICSIEPTGDGWYVVAYLDMGWNGMTRIKIEDGKIDDYTRCVSDL